MRPSWLQEVCNALFDALFDILPHERELDDAAPATLTRDQKRLLRWNDDAQALLEAAVCAAAGTGADFSGEATARCRREQRARSQ